MVEGIASTEDEDTEIRRACRLAEADLGNTIAFGTLLQILTSAESESIRKRAADNLKKILLDKQMPELIVSLKNCLNVQVNEYNFE
ncbi:MAG: hypothetical protein PUP91_34340 [Rhizonema sp. PD37]|nr:hypothetical protein [Rhizonema sp. PD37]